MLTDSRIATATEEILPNKNKSRHDIQLEIRRKERAAEAIVKAYTTNHLPEEIIRICLYSISDNNSFLNSNLKPIKECISLLEYYFQPKRMDPHYSLGKFRLFALNNLYLFIILFIFTIYVLIIHVFF